MNLRSASKNWKMPRHCDAYSMYIRMDESWNEAESALDLLIEGHSAICHKAAQCLIRVRKQW